MQQPQKCSQRTHIISDIDRTRCAIGVKPFIELQCSSCGKILYGCKECAEKKKLKSWAFINKDRHRIKDHSKLRGCGHNGNKKKIEQAIEKLTATK